MKKIFFSLVLCVLGVIAYAQQNNEVNYLGVVQLQNNGVVEGKIVIDFEKQLVTVQHETDQSQNLYAFYSIQHLWFYDHLKQVRREFVKKQQNLFEVVLQGEVTLLRKYLHNTTLSSTHQDNQYYLATPQGELVALQDLSKELNKVFEDNTYLIQKMVTVKKYSLTDLQNVATLIRYHNQCRAKTIAQR
jgi:hypothetical protein